MALSPLDKIQLGRAHIFGHWLEEGITSLVDGAQELTREELATLGWETAGLIFWIKDRLSRRDSNILSFRKDSIKCGQCTSSASLLSGSHNCSYCGAELEELTCASVTPSLGTADILVQVQTIMCSRCGRRFQSDPFFCSSCSATFHRTHNVRVTPKQSSKEVIKEIFGEEIKFLSMSVA
jgi:ribosomal protein L37E